MTWNHRIVKFKSEHGEYLGICEVYYDEDDKPFAHDKEPSVQGETVEEIKQQLEWMLESVKKPILDQLDIK